MKFYRVWKLLTHDLIMCENCLAACSGMVNDEGRFIHYCWRETFWNEPRKCNVCGETE